MCVDVDYAIFISNSGSQAFSPQGRAGSPMVLNVS